MKKSTSLQNKIKAYSAVALSVVGIGSLQSQVVYHDVIPDRVLTGNPETFDIDMDGNSTMDFQVQTRLGHQTNLNNLNGANNFIAGSTVAYTSFGYAQAFALGNPIGPALTNWASSPTQMILASTWNSTPYGNFGDGQIHYAAVNFKIGTNVVYGWIRFTAIPQNGATVTVMDWAYKSTPNTAINAGEGLVGINENTTQENINVFCFNKKLNINYLNATEKGNIKITNLMGQEIKNITITNSKMTIDMSDVVSGIYITTITNGENTITRKFNVK